MRYDLKLFILADSDGRESLLASLRACLGEGQRAFVLFAAHEPAFEGAFLSVGEGCAALAADKHKSAEMQPQASYRLDEFHLFILEDRLGQSAFQTARRLVEGDSASRDIILITDEGSPPELYSDVRFDRTVCINRMSQAQAVQNAVRSLIGPVGAGAAEKHAAPEAAAAPHPDQSARAAPGAAWAKHARSRFPAQRFSRLRRPAVVIAHALLIVGLVVSVLLQGGVKKTVSHPQAVSEPSAPAAPLFLPAPPDRQTALPPPEAGASAAAPKAKRPAAPEAHDTAAVVQPSKAASQTAPQAAPKRPVGVSVGLITANLRDEGRRVSLALQLQLTDAQHKEAVVRKMQQINGSFIEYLNYQSAAALMSSAGREQMRRHLVSRANRVLGREVVADVAITSFLLKERIRYSPLLPEHKQLSTLALPALAL